MKTGGTDLKSVPPAGGRNLNFHTDRKAQGLVAASVAFVLLVGLLGLLVVILLAVILLVIVLLLVLPVGLLSIVLIFAHEKAPLLFE